MGRMYLRCVSIAVPAIILPYVQLERLSFGMKLILRSVNILVMVRRAIVGERIISSTIIYLQQKILSPRLKRSEHTLKLIASEMGK